MHIAGPVVVLRAFSLSGHSVNLPHRCSTGEMPVRPWRVGHLPTVRVIDTSAQVEGCYVLRSRIEEDYGFLLSGTRRRPRLFLRRNIMIPDALRKGLWLEAARRVSGYTNQHLKKRLTIEGEGTEEERERHGARQLPVELWGQAAQLAARISTKMSSACAGLIRGPVTAAAVGLPSESLRKRVLRNEIFLKQIRMYAEIALKHKEGTCGDYAAVAFLQLLDYYKSVRPIDYINACVEKGCDTPPQGWNHSFVLIGSPVYATSKNKREWLPHSVVCDPFFREVSLAGTSGMLKNPGLKLASQCRYE